MSVKNKVKRSIGTIAAGVALAQWLIFLPAATPARGEKNAFNSDARYVLGFSADVSKILSVLENKMEDQQLLERTKDKLLTLDHGQIQLIASLSDQVIKEGNTTGSDIAFLLMTVLITLI